MPRGKIIEELAKIVASFGQHKVDLSGNAKMTIIVEIVKTVCCLSVLRDYSRFCKFNLLSVCGQPEKRAAENENGDYFVYISILIILIAYINSYQFKNYYFNLCTLIK